MNARVNSLAVSVFVSDEPSFERFGEDGSAIGFFGVGASVRLLASFFARVVIYEEGIEREHHHHLVPFRRPSLRVDLEKNALIKRPRR